MESIFPITTPISDLIFGIVVLDKNFFWKAENKSTSSNFKVRQALSSVYWFDTKTDESTKFLQAWNNKPEWVSSETEKLWDFMTLRLNWNIDFFWKK